MRTINNRVDGRSRWDGRDPNAGTDLVLNINLPSARWLEVPGYAPEGERILNILPRLREFLVRSTIL